jgi:signal peptidase II
MLRYFIIAAIIFVVDRLSKIAALKWCLNTPYHVTSFLSFDVIFNRGVSWGMLHSKDTLAFMLVTLMITVITAVVCWLAYRNYKKQMFILGEVCVITGSICNLLDRIVYAGVIDFIVLSYGKWTWPVFNIADMMIVMGVGLLFLRYEKSI